MATYHIGTSGWHYDHWRDRFYPSGLPKSGWLGFYARHFNTLEVNNSFYRLPTENAFAHWRDSSPPGFTFAVKVSRFITHVKKLRDADEPLQTFLSRAGILGAKLGPLLYQLPPNLKRDDDRLASFLSLLPSDLQHAFEFRNESWFDEGVFRILRDHNAALCIYDMGSEPSAVVATGDFAYFRFHGSARMNGCYGDDELREWARKIARIGAEVKSVFVYFNNDAEGFALKNAEQLTESLVERNREKTVC